MGRSERAIDPAEGPVQRFAWELRQLREAAGRPSYRSLAGRAHYSASMLSEAAAGLALPSLAVTLAYVRGCDGDAEQWERRWTEVRDELARDAPSVGPVGEESPYLGLSTFDTGDAGRFFGRAALVEELTARLTAAPLLAVFGASGSGKSSLLRAGLLSTVDSPQVLLTPGAEPVQELAAALAAVTGDAAAALHASLSADPAAIGPVVRQAARGELLVLVVDQFEEVFTLCRDEAARTRFIDCLLAVATGCADRARVVLGVRADFYAHCARHAGLVAALHDRQVLVGPMDEAGLRAVITEPARQAGCRVEPDLVAAIVADAAGQPGALPLVSHALLETWKRRQGKTLTLAGYRAAGSVADAVAQTAERLFTGLDPARQELVEQIFLRLTALGEGTEDTRRRAPYAELRDHPAAQEVLDLLAAGRLITCDETTVTVAHEALIRRWPRLRGWLATDRDLLLAHRRLTEAVAEWEQHGRDEAFLYRGKRLALFQDRRTDRLNQAERAFLEAGERRERRELTAGRRRTRRLLAALVAVVVVVTGLATTSTLNARQAARERDTAFADELAAKAREQLQLKPDLSLLLARRAMGERHTPAAEAALRQATVDSRVRAIRTAGNGQVFGVAYGAGGRQIATSGDNGTVRVWRTGADGAPTGAPRVLTGHTGEVWSPVFSPDGRRLAAAGVDGVISVWDLTAGDVPLTLRGHTGKVWTVAFSPDGRRLASTGDDGTVRIWDPVRGGAALTVRKVSSVRQLAVAYRPDGRRLAVSSGDGLIRTWDANGAGDPMVLRGHTDSVEALAYAPDGRTLASASTDGTARAWPVGAAGEPVVLRGQNAGTVETVSVSPDGRRIAAAGSDGTIRVFNAGGETHPLILSGHDGPVWSVAFSADGRRLLSGSGDGTVRLWDVTYPGDPTVLRVHTGPVWSVAANDAGRLLVTGGDDGTVRVWPVTGGTPRVFSGHRGPVQSVAMSRDGAAVAGAGDDGTTRVWSLATGRPVVLGGRHGGTMSVAFLPGGDRVVTGGQDGVVRVWNVGARTAVELRGHAGLVRSVAASPDGRHVASAGRDGTVRLWDVTGAAEPRVLRGHQGGLVWQVAFSPDGRRLASAGHDGTVRLWDVAGRQSPLILRGHRGAVWSVAFNPGTGLLSSTGDDGTVRFWRLDGPETLVALHGFGSPVAAVASGPDPIRFVSVHDDGTLRLSRCLVCASLPEVEGRAERLSIRDFTADEKQRYLSDRNTNGDAQRG